MKEALSEIDDDVTSRCSFREENAFDLLLFCCCLKDCGPCMMGGW